jgi:GntR family phosphonate transport system transcriptional regulator
MNDGVTRWRRVADDIRARISAGDLSGMLPPEIELAQTYGVNRHTVRRAIASLASEGLVRPERGRGTFVSGRQARIVYPIGQRTRFSEIMLSQSIEPSGRLVRSERVAADTNLAEILQCRPGDELHRLESLSVADGVPMSRSTSHFVAARFPGIIDAYAESGSITEALRREGVSDYRRSETRISAERVSATDTELLSCPADAIVLVSRAIDVELGGTPIQAIRSKFLADRMELVIRA